MAQERSGTDGTVRPSGEGGAAEHYPHVSEGRRSQNWQQRQTADQTSLWGTFIKACSCHAPCTLPFRLCLWHHGMRWRVEVLARTCRAM